jgi:hypothetical protein
VRIANGIFWNNPEDDITYDEANMHGVSTLITKSSGSVLDFAIAMNAGR